MTDNKKTTLKFISRRTLTLAIAACLLLSLGAAGYAAGARILGWGGNADYEITQDTAGVDTVTTVLHTDDLTEPVEFNSGRMIFTVNGEKLDITDEVSAEKAYIYEYSSDEDGRQVTHYILVGLNDGSPENYGFAEYIKDSESGEWLGGYSARTNIEADGTGAAWLENGKTELGITW